MGLVWRSVFYRCPILKTWLHERYQDCSISNGCWATFPITKMANPYLDTHISQYTAQNISDRYIYSSTVFPFENPKFWVSVNERHVRISCICLTTVPLLWSNNIMRIQGHYHKSSRCNLVVHTGVLHKYGVESHYLGPLVLRKLG